MNRPFILRAFMRVMAWVGVVALGSAMALAQDATQANASRSDGQIEMDVVHALDASQALKNDLITAATIESEVTLSGTVSSESSKQLAESIAKTVPGVTKVHNNLKVGNPADDANAQGAPLNDPANDMGDAQPQQNAQNPSYGQNPNYGQEAGQAPAPDENAGSGQAAPSINQAPPPDWGSQSAGPGQTPQQQQRPPYEPNYPQQPAYGQNYPQQSPYGQPPGYGQAPPPGYGQGPGYAQAPPPPRYEIPRGPVTIPQGTLIQVRTNDAVSNKHAQGGEAVQFTVIQDVTLGDSARSDGAWCDRRSEASADGCADGEQRTGAAAYLAGVDGTELSLAVGSFQGEGTRQGRALGRQRDWRRAGGRNDRRNCGRRNGSCGGCGRRRRNGSCGFGSDFRTGSMDSRRSAGELPSCCPGDGATGNAAGGDASGAGSVSRRAEAISASCVLRVSVSAVSVLLRAGVLPAVLLFWRVLLLAVRRCKTARGNWKIW